MAAKKKSKLVTYDSSVIAMLVIDPKEFAKAQKILIRGVLKNLHPEWHYLVKRMTIYSSWTDADGRDQQIQLLAMRQLPLPRRRKHIQAFRLTDNQSADCGKKTVSVSDLELLQNGDEQLGMLVRARAALATHS